jgi:hypothetical protein
VYSIDDIDDGIVCCDLYFQLAWLACEQSGQIWDMHIYVSVCVYVCV